MAEMAYELYNVTKRSIFINPERQREENRFMKHTNIVSDDRSCYITLTHDDNDPAMWIVRRWKKIMWFKKRISSNWFIGKEQAMTFATEMKRISEDHDNTNFTQRKQ